MLWSKLLLQLDLTGRVTVVFPLIFVVDKLLHEIISLLAENAQVRLRLLAVLIVELFQLIDDFRHLADLLLLDLLLEAALPHANVHSDVVQQLKLRCLDHQESIPIKRDLGHVLDVGGEREELWSSHVPIDLLTLVR